MRGVGEMKNRIHHKGRKDTIQGRKVTAPNIRIFVARFCSVVGATFLGDYTRASVTLNSSETEAATTVMIWRQQLSWKRQIRLRPLFERPPAPKKHIGTV